MTERDVITRLCEELATKRNARFIGYNTATGSRMYGTLGTVGKGVCIETPCAENLMAGIAIGMALERTFLPVVCFERHEFALFALGQLGVMADKFHRVCGVRLPMVVRLVRGATKPLDPGEQHNVSYSTTLISALEHSAIVFPQSLNLDYLDQQLATSPSGIVAILEDRDEYEREV